MVKTTLTLLRVFFSGCNYVTFSFNNCIFLVCCQPIGLYGKEALFFVACNIKVFFQKFIQDISKEVFPIPNYKRLFLYLYASTEVKHNTSCMLILTKSLEGLTNFSAEYLPPLLFRLLLKTTQLLNDKKM